MKYFVSAVIFVLSVAFGVLSWWIWTLLLSGTGLSIVLWFVLAVSCTVLTVYFAFLTWTALRIVRAE